MASLMYPAYQKYYSAICNLERFSIEKNFFDNISSLDNFFSEYRSVTLVMQKSLAHTQYAELYQNVSKGIWDKFFNDQRVKAIHAHPVEFIKKIEITVYYPDDSISVLSQDFSVENDVPLSDLIDSLKKFFERLHKIEVFFSDKFRFIEKDSGVDLWDKINEGIITMHRFMDIMYSEIGEKCPLCEKLRKKIDKVELLKGDKDFCCNVDYVYYPKQERFEKGGKMTAFLGSKFDCVEKRQSLKSFISAPLLKHWTSIFEKFVFLNTIIGSTDLMPTIMTVYQDDTYDLDIFNADIKTTFYRKINNAAKKIICNEVKEVFVMVIYVQINYEENLINMTSKERIEKATNEFLSFMKVDNNLNEEEYIFDSKYINQIEYIAYVMKNGKQKKLVMGSTNMKPIIEAFKKQNKEKGK